MKIFLFLLSFSCFACLPALSSIDVDEDGYGFNDDCDDHKFSVNPGEDEVCDGLDNDCDGSVDEDDATDTTTWYADVDGDGYGDASQVHEACEAPKAHVASADDCDDSNALINPGTDDDCGNGEDEDCSGDDLACEEVDEDGDGYSANEGDCDDSDALVNPDADEVCDSADNDCDGDIDEDDAVDATTWYADSDGDGYGDVSQIHVACEAPEAHVASADDCDDTDADINLGATEYCDAVDNDCDGAVDEDDALDATTWYADADGDEYGDTAMTHVSCSPPSSYVAYAGDCDDSDPAYNPSAEESDCADPNDYNCDGATDYTDADSDRFAACEECDDTNAAINPDADEVCDSADNDCDGDIDEDDAVDATTWYADSDGDGYGDVSQIHVACEAPEAHVASADDCDDTNAAINLGAEEVCDFADNDCDTATDEGFNYSNFYLDSDGDGYGNPSGSTLDCECPDGYSPYNMDCDDASAISYPGASEVCDDLDNDCDGGTDEDAVDPTVWYLDSDGDGYGGTSHSFAACQVPSGYVATNTDCDDTDLGVYPGADEYCDGADNDCDGVTDEDEAVDVATWYRDLDSDGFGTVAHTDLACDAPTGYVADSTDCDDGSPSINPDASETCDGFDNDCDGSVDEDFDEDGDGWATCDDDCDDTESVVNPGEVEICDGLDNDCDGTVDTGDTLGHTWSPDVDGDGYGDSSSAPVYSCTIPSGYADNDDDCDDADASINPGTAEAYSDYGDGTDQDCNGADDLWYVTDGDTFCVTSMIFTGCYADEDAYLVGDSPLGSYIHLLAAGFVPLGDIASGFYCFDFYAEYPDTPRYYEFTVVSAKSVSDATCGTAVATTSSADWVYGDFSDYCEVDPYGFCDGSYLHIYEDGVDDTTLESW